MLLLARFVLASVFVVAGIAKLRDRAGSRAAMADFGVPPSLTAPLAVALPLVELLVAIALIPSASARWGTLGALVLLGVFAAGIVSIMIRGREVECHCFGQLHSKRVGWPTLGRNIALALVAGFVLAGSRTGQDVSYSDWIGGLSTTELLVLSAGSIALTILAAAGWFFLQLLRQHGRMLLRLDALEGELAARGIIAHPSGVASEDGLAPGTPAPEFALGDLSGGSVTLADLLAEGRPLMLVFSHAGCTPCVALLPEIGLWQSTHRASLGIALISQGSADDNRAASAEHGIEHVLVQRERETAEAYHAYATPSAVVISREGIIDSHVAQGAVAIRAMVASAVATASPHVTHAANGHGNDMLWGDTGAGSIGAMGLDAH